MTDGGARPPARAVARAGEGAAGGDPACWAHLVCPECGAFFGDRDGGQCDCGVRQTGREQADRPPSGVP